MGTQREAGYYDDCYSQEPISLNYTCHYTKSPYHHLWKEVLRLMNPKQKILEVGCGTGQLGAMIKSCGFKDYIGFDFSTIGVELARSLGLNVFRGDAREKESFEYQYDIAIMLEVLEHTDDHAILENIPTGKEIIITVPDFDDPAHIRHFGSFGEVCERYEGHVSIDFLKRVDRWHLVKGTRL